LWTKVKIEKARNSLARPTHSPTIAIAENVARPIQMKLKQIIDMHAMVGAVCEMWPSTVRFWSKTAALPTIIAIGQRLAYID